MQRVRGAPKIDSMVQLKLIRMFANVYRCASCSQFTRAQLVTTEPENVLTREPKCLKVFDENFAHMFVTQKPLGNEERKSFLCFKNRSSGKQAPRWMTHN